MIHNLKQIYRRALTVSFVAIFLATIAPQISTAATAVPEDMVLVNAGGFTRGIDNTKNENFSDEGPAKMIYLSSYYIDKFEVSNSKYTEFIIATDHPAPAYWDHRQLNQPSQPVTGVNWFDSDTYCRWANKRLPTEAEWEKAARGKRPVKYPWGNTPPDSSKLNYNEDIKKTTAVGSFENGKSDYGIYDLSGNVAEWVNDWHYPEYYLFSPKENPPGPETGKYKIIRGGSWRHNAEDVNLTYRNATTPVNRSTSIGFRCARRAAEGN